MTYPAASFQEKTTPELLMRSSNAACYQLGRMHEKYSSLSSWLTQSPLTFDAQIVETLSSFFSDYLYQRDVESHLDQSLLDIVETEPSEALFMVLKMRCHVIESRDNLLDPLLKKMEQTEALTSFFLNQDTLPVSEEMIKSSLRKESKKREFARLRTSHQRKTAAAASQKTKEASKEPTDSKKQVRWGHQAEQPLSTVKKEEKPPEFTLSQRFNECLSRRDPANQLRMDVAFKVLNHQITMGHDAWKWACLKEALPLLRSMVHAVEQLNSKDQSSSESPRSASEELDLPTSEEESQEESEFSDNSVLDSPSFLEYPPFSYTTSLLSQYEASASADLLPPVALTEQHSLNTLGCLVDYLDSEQIRPYVESLSRKTQHKIQRRMATEYEKFRKKGTKPDRSWGKRHCFDPKRLNSLREVLKEMGNA
jgi:hypothetical protein